MEAIIWFVTLLLIFGVVMFTPLNTIILRYLYKNERISPSSSTAQNNVTLYNEYNGMKYAPVSVEPIGDDEFAIRVESREAPYRETVLTVKREQFKHDPIKVCETGMPNYRIVQRELVDPNFGINDELTCDPTYTKEELQDISRVNFQRITELEGELSNEKATIQEQVRDIMEHTTRYNNSMYRGEHK